MNIPNILTILRLALTLGFLYLFSINVAASALFFILAAVTDFFDGYWARKYSLITSFGKIMDPIADKFLVLSAFALLAGNRLMPWWMFWIFAVREVGVTMFRFWAASRGKVLAAESAGKVKTVLQMATVIFFLVSVMIFPRAFLKQEFINGSSALYAMALFVFDTMLLWISVILTLLSGISVIWNNRIILKR
ncbi:MAG: CDP-diacylglycerol--glycerol-3-phosphate 3-phosphatidyltransferase [Candidatus Omnitrophota bacterium]